MERRELATHLLLPVVVLASGTIVFETLGLDPLISDRFYDFNRAVWPFREHWLTQAIIHHLGRSLVELVGSSVLVVWLGSWMWPPWRLLQRRAAYLVLTLAVAIALVSLAKYVSVKHCPWDIERYGGSVPLESLFAVSQPGTCAGHCFPASHASVGFSLMALYFVFRDHSRALRRIGLGIGLVVGFVFSLGQVARGAHFFSHGIWSAVLCWYVCLGMYEIAFQRRLEYPIRQTLLDVAGQAGSSRLPIPSMEVARVRCPVAAGEGRLAQGRRTRDGDA